jgi:hypothetical protein
MGREVMRSADPKAGSARVETLPGVTRSLEILVFGFEAGEVFVEGVIVGTVYVVG